MPPAADGHAPSTKESGHFDAQQQRTALFETAEESLRIGSLPLLRGLLGFSLFSFSRFSNGWKVVVSQRLWKALFCLDLFRFFHGFFLGFWWIILGFLWIFQGFRCFEKSISSFLAASCFYGFRMLEVSCYTCGLFEKVIWEYFLIFLGFLSKSKSLVETESKKKTLRRCFFGSWRCFHLQSTVNDCFSWTCCCFRNHGAFNPATCFS